MIKKSHRFHGLGSLRFVFNKGQTVRSQQCSLRYNLNPRRQTFRAAVVVSKKVHKNAVVRNRIRRRIYEIVRSQEPNIKQPFDMVITVYSEQLADIEHAELEEIIIELLEKSKIIKAK